MEKQTSLIDIEKKHIEILWPTVRVKADKAWGSGTIIYSGKDAKGNFHTYVITCEHVVDDNIKVEEKWDPQAGMDVKKEIRTPVEVELFSYEHLSHAKGLAGSHRAFIRAYDKDQDIALLELDKTTETGPVAKVFPRSEIEDEIHIFDRIYACGAAMGHEPVATEGTINFMDEIIDDYIYWLGNAPTIFGNSGGAVFRYSPVRDEYEFIGMPAKIAVAMIGFGGSAITHMGWFVPITRIYAFLDKNYYNFMYSSKTYEQCETDRKRAEEESRKLFMARFGGLGKEDKEDEPARQSR